MATITLDGPYTTVSNLVFNGFTTSNSGSTLTLQAPTPSTAGTGIGISGTTINNTQPAPAIKVGSYTWQPSSVSLLEFMHSTAALSGSTLTISPSHNYYYAGSGIAIDGSKVITNTAQGSPNWDVTVFNGNVEYPISGGQISDIKFPYQMKYSFTSGVLQLLLGFLAIQNYFILEQLEVVYGKPQMEVHLGQI